MQTSSPAYRNAFAMYLRRGIPLDVSLKAAAQAVLHPTPYYIWRTQGDGKVRPAHAANNGKIFAWDNPPPTGNPGEAYGCRCWAEPYDGLAAESDAIDSTYEDIGLIVAIILLLRGNLAVAWRAWLLARTARTWRLGSYKSAQRWANQMEKGGWTPEKISEVVKYGEKYPGWNDTAPANGRPATIYQLGDDYVVIDNATREVIQVSRPGFKPPYLGRI